MLTVAESWVEVSSQPSSSSLSSIGDEIVTTGLQVGSYARRRRLQASSRALPQQQTAIYNAGTSSQEEYDESESEDDQLLTSSTEHVPYEHQRETDDALDGDDDSDDGDNATALGQRPPDQPVFRPQPNAFTHPQGYVPHRSHSSSSAMPPHPHSSFTRPSFSQRAQTRIHRGGPNFMSPSAREDNEAALRASLTTLLSCAAAARGLPKSTDEAQAHRPTGQGVGPSNQPVGLRLVPESELLAEGSSPTPAQAPSPPSKQRSTPRSSSRGCASERSKRSVSAGRTPRATKKKKTGAAEEALISPTLLTWVVSAGVVVLVSVVGFGAGYVIGREVGYQEGLSASVGSGLNETTSCGREVIRSSGGSLRRFKWSAVGKSIVA
ncbi:hypothetical protein NLU13_2087 [Sarocladium strictum]|uniref:Uncharacterized protein n=1 Tax=Sarocladium strictum TaxID=5046 RepID=A0AA39GUY9_SARSR|nr:hypothetical protein NLU13_2087 [Sarocladium strictum]